MGKKSGFTLIETVIVLAVIGILAAVAVPALTQWLPAYRLKGAAWDLYGNLKMARSGAITENKDWAVVFEEDPLKYSVYSDWGGPDERVDRAVILGDYGSGVDFGHGAATEKVSETGVAITDDLDYGGDLLIFGSNGTSNAGFVYLDNGKNKAYAIGTYISGLVLLKSWTGGDWQ